LLYFAEFPFNQNTLNYEEIMHVFHIDPMKFYLCMRDAGRGMYFLYYHHNLFTFSPMLYYWMYMFEMIFIVFFCFVM